MEVREGREGREEIRISGICKSFEGKQVLRDFSARLPLGKVSCLMAASGAGKTTLLRILMGLEQADQGQLHGLEGLKKSAVFQEDRLCEYLSPVGNIRLVSPKLRKEDVLSAMEAVGLRDCAAQPCSELSGGMRRRVALLRALLAEYDILFLDEPFKGLDAETKTLVIRDTRERCEGRTVLLVSHEPKEAEEMGAVQLIRL
ncbi:MAG: ATP-binding cassette domain-containing protein [Bacillota bacterium]|nr:ATP-binding cassette domain-containing protein [Bacillota bacterium]